MSTALYFTATNATNGRELWRVNADGSVTLAADIYPGASSSSPAGQDLTLSWPLSHSFTVFNNELYFSAADLNGTEPWKLKADGTVVPVADLFPFGGNSNPAGFTPYNGELYFSARNGTLGYELWKVKADGSVAMVADINAGAGDSNPGRFLEFPNAATGNATGFTVFNNELYFNANDGSHGTELWKVKANGTAALVADINLGGGSSGPDSFAVYNNAMYFSADSGGGRQLWKVKSDGSVALAFTVAPGGLGNLGPQFTTFNNELFFVAGSAANGTELWKVKADGSVVLAADVNPGVSGSFPAYLTVFNGALFFQARDADHGFELWKLKTDGTASMVADKNPGAGSLFPSWFGTFNNELYFTADDGTHGVEPWKLRADGSMVMVADINPSGDSNPFGFTAFNGELYFEAKDVTRGYELWKVKTDGSVALVSDMYPGVNGSDPQYFTIFSVPSLLVTNLSSNTQSNSDGTPYSGPVAGLQYQYINITPDNLNVTALLPNGFIHTGSGFDAIDVSKVSGINVLDGGTNSNFLVGGTAAGSFDTFFVDNRSPPGDIWSTVVNFHKGDDATVWGVTQAGFNLAFANGEGAAGFTGLTLHVTKTGVPTASLTLAGFSTADLTNGKLSTSFGSVQGNDYFYVHGNS